MVVRQAIIAAERTTGIRTLPRSGRALLRRLWRGRIRLGGRGGGDTAFPRPRGRREGLARRRTRLAGGDRPRARARRAGRRDPAPRPPQPPLRPAPSPFRGPPR